MQGSEVSFEEQWSKGKSWVCVWAGMGLPLALAGP